jgi:transcriptional regulator with XRE-family HTH domain
MPPDNDPGDARIALGRGIRALRLYHGWSQQMLEDRSGLDQTIISRLETGRPVPVRLSRVLAMLDAMGVDRIILKTRLEGPSIHAFMTRLAPEDDPYALGPVWKSPFAD